jgi:hypothetical protein
MSPRALGIEQKSAGTGGASFSSSQWSQADPSREGSHPRDPLVRGAHDVLKPCAKIRPLVKTRFPGARGRAPSPIRRVVHIPIPKLSAATVDPSGASPYQSPFHLSPLTLYSPTSRRPDSEPKRFVWLHPEGNNRAERKQSHGANKRQSPIVRLVDNIPERHRRKNGRQR